MPHSSRVALITGCGKPIGIGNSTARALAAKGIAVVVSDVRPAGVANEHNAPGDLDTNWGGVDSLVEQIAKAGGTASSVLGDVSREDDARRIAGTAARDIRKAPLALTPIVKSQAATGTFSISLRSAPCGAPALLTRISRRP